MEKLRKQRQALGLTQHQLARLAGVNYSRLTFFETGRRKPTRQELTAIREALARRYAQIGDIVAA